MSNNNNFVFKALHVIAWVIFVGLCIEAGALIVNFIYSLFKPEVVGNLYQKLDLSKMYQRSNLVYFGVYGFILAIAILKAVLFYVVIELLQKLDLAKPFSPFAAGKIKDISYYTFSIGMISYIAKEVTKNLVHHGYEPDKLNHFWEDAQAFILMAGIVFVIAQIFQKGIELQNENDLTV